ncbi:Lipase A [Cladobotryum mycophilum]|uniref:Lipase A n=1 Tax=Cladobotryum mycophilum TaxID=491253 RepID=A0ABR0T2I8_9HYPO
MSQLEGDSILVEETAIFGHCSYPIHQIFEPLDNGGNFPEPGVACPVGRCLCRTFDRRGESNANPPSQDAFYAVPQEGLSTAAPGSILRHRAPPSPIAAFTLVPLKLKDSHQILYRTNDNKGNPTATVLTVLVPFNASYDKVVSFQPAQDSACPDCAPSYALQRSSATGGFLGTFLSQLELLIVEAVLENGYIVVIPDHEGPHAAFLANRMAGQATLDGVRAALNSASFTGIHKDAKIAIWGYSGGSLATSWAAELQPTYAPELKINGAILGGLVPNITTVIRSVNNSTSCGILPSGAFGLAHEYPYIADFLSKHILPQYRDDFYKAETQCLVASILQFRNKNALAMFDDPKVFFTDPGVVSIFDENRVGQLAPKIPLYVYKSASDELSPVGETDAVVQGYCARGTRVQYLRDIVSDHTTLAGLGAPKVLSWIHDIMEGVQLPPGCTTKTVTTSLWDTATLRFVPKAIVDAILDLLGKPVGPL